VDAGQTTTTDPAAALGTTGNQPLPATGSSTNPVTALALALIVVGSLLAISGRRATAER
jgi:LPXTG-motif cell wall-anchored protein